MQVHKSKHQNYLILILGFFFVGVAHSAGEVPQAFTFDGRLYSDSSGATPMNDPNITVRVQILDQTQTCILYEETQSGINTTTSSGYFTIQVGSSPASGKRTAGDSGHVMTKVYSNTGGTIVGKAVSDGAACTFIPVAGDQRFVRMTVTPSSTGVASTLSPNMPLDSVPNALVAERAENLQGFGPNDLLRVNITNPAMLSQANLENIFSATNYPRLTSMLAGTTVLSPLAPATTPSTGQMWYDSGAIKYYDGSTTQTLGAAGAGITSLVAGTGLNVGAGPGGTISSTGTLNIDVGTTGNKIVQLNAGKLPAVDGSDLTNVVSSDISSMTATTGIVQRTGANSYSSVTVASPLTYTGGTLGVSTVSNGVVMDGGNTVTGAMNVGTNAAQSLNFRTNSTTKMTILSNGNVGIGSTNPGTSLDLSSKTDAVALPSGTTAQRPVSPVNGYTRYNTDLKGLESYVNGGWQQVSSGTSPTATEDGKSLRWNDTTKQFDWFTAGGGGGSFLPLTGGTMTGPIVLSSSNTATSGAGNVVNSFSTNYMPASAPGAGTAVVGTANSIAANGASNVSNVTLKTQSNSVANNIGSNLSAMWAVDNTVSNNTAGNVTTTYGSSNQISNVSGGTMTTAYGTYNVLTNSSNGTISTAVGSDNTINNQSNGTITSAVGLQVGINNLATGGITTAYGIRLFAPTNASGGPFTTSYGLYIENPTEAGTNYSIYSAGGRNYFAGNVGIGTTNPTAALQLKAGTSTANTAPLKFTAGTSLSTAEAGAMEYDGANLYFTPSGTTRRAIAYADELGAANSVAAGAGANTAPSISFSGDPNTGLFSNGADVLGITTGGTTRFNVSSAGLVSATTGGANVTAANGSAAAPTYSFAGDPGTGWWRPAANSMAASTGGVERMLIDSNGNVGLGTSLPGSPLTISKSWPTENYIDLVNTHAGTDFATALKFTFTDRSASMEARKPSGGDGTAIIFKASDNVDNTVREKMRIDANGSVGIGTTTPNTVLHLTRDGTSGGVILDSARADGYGSFFWGRTSRGTVASPTVSSAADVAASLGGFAHNGTGFNSVAAMLLTADGTQTTSSAPGAILFQTTPAAATTPTEKMRITSSGNVGIGTTTPTVSLDLGTKTDAIRLPAGTTAQQPGTPAVGMIRYNTNGGTPPGWLEFYNGSAWVNLASTTSGNFTSVGSVTGSANLTLSGLTAATSSVIVGNTTSSVGTASGALVVNGGVGVAGDIYTGASINAGSTISAATSVRAPSILGSTAASGNLTLDSTSDGTKGNIILAPNGGNVGIGTSNPQSALDVHGNIYSTANTGSFRTWGIPGNLDTSLVLQASAVSGSGGNIELGRLGEIRYDGTIHSFRNVDASSTFVTFSSNGNVGIGTTAPTERLDVANKFRIGVSRPANQDILAGTQVDSYDDNMTLMASPAVPGTNTLQLMAWGPVYGWRSMIETSNVTSGIPSVLLAKNGGNVGIGTTNPTAKLDVVGNSTTAHQTIRVRNNGTTGDSPASFNFSSGTGVEGSLYTYGTGGYVGTSSNSDFSLVTNNAIRLMAKAAGNVGIGTLSPTNPLHVVSSTASSAIYGQNTSTGIGVYGESASTYGVYGSTSSAAAGAVAGVAQNSTIYGILGFQNTYALYGTGNAYVTGTYLGSDLRLKKDVQSLENGLDTIMKLRPVSYKWKEGSDQATSQKGVKHGFIAQEVKKILPDAVIENTPPVLPGTKKLSLNQQMKSFLTVEYNEFIAYLAKAVQELNQNFLTHERESNKRIAQVEKDNARLKQENIEMRLRLEKIEKLIQK